MSAPFHPNLGQLSHSSCVTLHRCPRKYELEKLSVRIQNWGEEDLDFGHIVGAGIQDYLITHDYKKAVFNAFLSWKGDLDENIDGKKKKSFWHAIHAIERFIPFADNDLSHYVLATLNGRPATEVGFSIDCGDGFFYRGFVDAVMIHVPTNTLVVIECKTTRNQEVHEATFKHSGQALGYSLILDAIAAQLSESGAHVGSNYKVIYPVYKTSANEWESLEFGKSKTQRALWIRSLLIDKQHIQQYAEEGYFPMHGESCYDFFRACPFFGTCELSNKYIIGNEIQERVEKEDKYDFHFSIAELIEMQLATMEG